MKVLLLTPIDPTNSGIYWNQMSNHLKENNVKVISIPSFAEIHARESDQMFLPTLFSFWKTIEDDKKVRRKIFTGSNLLFIGNAYKTHEFDMIVSLGEEEENTYINEILKNDKFEETRLVKEARKLYKWEDAEINLPTIEHAQKFMEGVFKKKNG